VKESWGRRQKKKINSQGRKPAIKPSPVKDGIKFSALFFLENDMKRKDFEIEIGGVYADGKGGEREVIGIGPEFKLYGSQENEDCLRYKLTAKKRGPYPVGSERNCTTVAFRSWCKKRIK
jgi:hypothetical protein